jgi:hypothetical protein
MSLVWATRGRTWGFTFLRNDSSEDDPLPLYDAAFQGLDGEPEAWQRVSESGERPDMVALRFPDPEERLDQAGRLIPHEFVVFGAIAAGIDSVETGRQLVWPLVEEQFARVWQQPTPPSSNG